MQDLENSKCDSWLVLLLWQSLITLVYFDGWILSLQSRGKGHEKILMCNLQTRGFFGGFKNIVCMLVCQVVLHGQNL
jgi:hypothetical protein